MDAKIRRLTREIQEITESDESIRDEMTVGTVDDCLDELVATIKGPPDTPYENGRFDLEVKIPDNYPFSPPRVKFITKIWHPNISSASGYICLDVLYDQWSPTMTLKSIFLSLQVLLADPNPDDPQDGVVARQMKRQRRLFRKTAQYWTSFFAMGNDAFLTSDFEDYNDLVAAYEREHRVTTGEAIVHLSTQGWQLPLRRSTRLQSRRQARQRGHGRTEDDDGGI